MRGYVFKLLVSAALVFVAFSDGHAASVLSSTSVVNWTGFYIGAHVGFGQGPATITDTTTANGSLTTTDKGFLGGGQIGYNRQLGSVVLGVEGDISAANIDGSTAIRDANGDVSTSNPKLRWASLVTGRFGYAMDRALLYVKGGVAFAGFNYSATDITNGGVARANVDRVGAAVGGGIEYALSPSWSARAEYDYLNFASRNFSIADPTGAVGQLALKQQLHQAKFGVNYHLGSSQ
ncbi:MAG: porin family protein [Rhizobiales bacterium]|nr:porin family protein [Hyphomicrobiales bacterium]